ncbi:L,D-transpeptidase family protein [Methylacidiphilum kamchatkense]|uniref:L,D-transpeptidase family protein n=1 Tax=Methylacidiphilum kamchatkense TaxID=431057 RepID=UPI0023EDC01C|nr:L,D-transpeptidase family protein [Methylacidiphilum kamchatkense]
MPAIWWNVNPSEKVTKLEINLSEQKLYVYQGGRLAAISPICSGTKDHPTPLGRFTVINKEILHRSNKYGCFVDSKGKIIYANATVGMTPLLGFIMSQLTCPFSLG